MASSRRIRRRRTSLNRAHKVALVASVLLCVVGLMAVALGAYSWSLDRNPPVQVRAGVGASPGDTPLFDAGVTLFVREGDLDGHRPSTWGCSLVTDEGRRALVQPGDIERTGTRVHDGIALVPALVVGETNREDVVTCTDLPSEAQMWSLPTDPGYPRVPMVLVIGGIALMGISALAHPRSRGLNRFL